MYKSGYILLFLIGLTFLSCDRKMPDQTRVPLLEVEGRFLYLDQIQDIIPPNVKASDSAEIADSYIRKWTTDVLLYETARRNISDNAEIERLLEDYKKSLIIHQYQQRLIRQRLSDKPSEEELKSFYDKYGSQFVLKENLLEGILLVVPKDAPMLDKVRSWVQSGNSKSLEQIEKYSIRNALSYDYFADRWVPFNEILKKMPIQLENPSAFLSSYKYYEVSDSLKIYMLSIESVKKTGEREPYETAKDKIANIILNQRKSEFIFNFENELYKDAVKNGTVTFFNKNND